MNLRTLIVLELALDVTSQDDAGQQIGSVVTKLEKLRERSPALRQILRALRVAIDVPGGEPSASAVLSFLDGHGDTPGSGWTPIGQQEIPVDRLDRTADRFGPLVEDAQTAGRHLWVATLAHRASDTLLDAYDGSSTATPILDPDTLVYGPAVGCYVCETPYSSDLRRSVCPGEPDPNG